MKRSLSAGCTRRERAVQVNIHISIEKLLLPYFQSCFLTDSNILI